MVFTAKRSPAGIMGGMDQVPPPQIGNEIPGDGRELSDCINSRSSVQHGA